MSAGHINAAPKTSGHIEDADAYADAHFKNLRRRKQYSNYAGEDYPDPQRKRPPQVRQIPDVYDDEAITNGALSSD